MRLTTRTYRRQVCRLDLGMKSTSCKFLPVTAVRAVENLMSRSASNLDTYASRFWTWSTECRSVGTILDSFLAMERCKLSSHGVKARPFILNTNEIHVRLSPLHWLTTASSCRATNSRCPFIRSAFSAYLWTHIASGRSTAASRNVHFTPLSFVKVTEIPPRLQSYPIFWVEDYRTAMCEELIARRGCCKR